MVSDVSDRQHFELMAETSESQALLYLVLICLLLPEHPVIGIGAGILCGMSFHRYLKYAKKYVAESKRLNLPED